MSSQQMSSRVGSFSQIEFALSLRTFHLHTHSSRLSTAESYRVSEEVLAQHPYRTVPDPTPLLHSCINNNTEAASELGKSGKLHSSLSHPYCTAYRCHLYCITLDEYHSVFMVISCGCEVILPTTVGFLVVSCALYTPENSLKWPQNHIMRSS